MVSHGGLPGGVRGGHGRQLPGLLGGLEEPAHEDRHQLLRGEPGPGRPAGDPALPASQHAGGRHRDLVHGQRHVQDSQVHTGQYADLKTEYYTVQLRLYQPFSRRVILFEFSPTAIHNFKWVKMTHICLI